MAAAQVVFAWGAGEDGQLGLEQAPLSGAEDDWHVTVPTVRPALSGALGAKQLSRARDCRAPRTRPSRTSPRFPALSRAVARACVAARAQHAPAPSVPPPRRRCAPRPNNLRAAAPFPPRQPVPAFAGIPLRAEAGCAGTPLVGGSRQSLAVSADGGLFTWGWNQKSSLGLGHQQAAQTPCRVNALAGVRVTQARRGSRGAPAAARAAARAAEPPLMR
jgi:hypothetical protein